MQDHESLLALEQGQIFISDNLMETKHRECILLPILYQSTWKTSRALDHVMQRIHHKVVDAAGWLLQQQQQLLPKNFP